MDRAITQNDYNDCIILQKIMQRFLIPRCQVVAALAFCMLPKEAIEEYKKMYFKEYKIKISDEEASFRANNLVNLYKGVYGTVVGKIVNGTNKNHEKRIINI